MAVQSCPSSTPVAHGVVVFVPEEFKVAFPEFATVADAMLTINFNLATLQLNKGCTSRVVDAQERDTLLNLLTAHITQLRNGINGQPASLVVGRVSAAQEGSVHADLDMGTVTLNAAYFLQTQWGALYWQSTAKYRTAVYVPAPVVCADFGGMGGGPYGFGGGCG